MATQFSTPLRRTLLQTLPGSCIESQHNFHRLRIVAGLVSPMLLQACCCRPIVAGLLLQANVNCCRPMLLLALSRQCCCRPLSRQCCCRPMLLQAFCVAGLCVAGLCVAGLCVGGLLCCRPLCCRPLCCRPCLANVVTQTYSWPGHIVCKKGF